MQPNAYKGDTRYSEELLTCDIELSASEVLIFGKIASMARTDNGAWAGNDYLAKVGRCSRASVTRVIIRLCELGLIRTNGSRNNRRFYLQEAGWALASVIAGEAATAPLPPAEEAPPAKPKKERKKAHPTIEEHCARELPGWLPADAWRAFVEYRHKDKGPFTERTADGVIATLTTLRAEGHDPRKLLELAASRGWLVPYPDKDGRTKGTAPLQGDNRFRFGGRVVL